MWASKGKNYCRQVRDRVLRLLAESFSLDRLWIQNHIANCPRCQQRIAHLGKVELAISLLKSQPHNLNLLMRANTQAIGILKHCLRTTPKAEHLKTIRPDLSIIERFAGYKHSLAGVAACIVIAFVMKYGVFSSAKMLESKGQKAVENYYASNAGEDIAHDIFTRNA